MKHHTNCDDVYFCSFSLIVVDMKQFVFSVIVVLFEIETPLYMCPTNIMQHFYKCKTGFDTSLLSQEFQTNLSVYSDCHLIS